MEHWPGTPTAHPVAGLVADLRTALDKSATTPVWTLTAPELRELVPEIVRARAQLAALEMRVLVEAERHDVGQEAGFTSTAHWVATTTRQVKPAAVADLGLARSLDIAHEPVRDALAAGDLVLEQARVIVSAVDALPDDLEPSLRADAEAHLIGLAAEHDAKTLRILGRKVLDVLAPELAEAHEYAALLAEEQRATATAELRLRSDGHGSTYGWFKVPDLHAAMLSKHLEALAAPRRAAMKDGPGTTVARPLRLGAAFTEYIETHTSVPDAGGIAATIVVTTPLEALLGEARVATLDTGDRITADEAVRLLCGADLIPAFLGGPGVELNLGRSRRLFSKHQRIALALRYGGCAEEHCDWPPSMCHAHHRQPWAKGGNTDLDDGVLLCPRHHTLAHDARFQLKAAKNGRVAFSRRT